MAGCEILPKFDGVNGLTPDEFDDLVITKAIHLGWNDEETVEYMMR